MTSLIRYATKAVKIPAGRTIKAQPDQPFLTSLDYQPYCFQKSDIDALLSPGFIQISDSLYSAKTNADLSGVLNSLNSLDDYWFEDEEYTAVDLGKTIRIGVAGGDNDIITMRLVKRTGTVESMGYPVNFPGVCYVVTGNRLGKDYSNALYCSILGTTPNNRTKKPFISNGGYEPLIVAVSTFESIFAATLKVSGSLYLARNVSEFNNILDALSDSSNYETLPFYELSSIDMGKSVRFGIVGGENDLLVFRLVKRTGDVASLGGPTDVPYVGYICIASKINLSDPEGAAEPACTGTSPNALEIKPQFISNGGYEPAMFTVSDFESILADCVKVSGSLYLANSASQLTSVCNTLNDWTGRDYVINDSTTTIDMGKTIRIGIVGGDNDLITFASTRAFTDAHPDELTSGFVVVGSKISKDYNNGALYVSVLGSAPRNC